VLFTIMVMMAVLTTLMASPLFEMIYGRHLARSRLEAAGAAVATP